MRSESIRSKKNQEIGAADGIGNATEALLPAKTQSNPIKDINRWKKASLFILVLIAIIIIANILLLLYLNFHQPLPTNTTFLTEIIASSNILQRKQQVKYLLANMRDSQGEPQFQSATRIDDFALRAASAVTLDSLNREDIVKVFSSKISRVIILASANIGQQLVSFAFSVNGNYVIPSSTKPSTTYYTFQIGSQRQSTLLSLHEQVYLRMNGSTSDLKRCRTYALSEESFFLLETVQIVFGSPAKLSFSVSAADCFTNNISKNMNQVLQRILGVPVPTEPVELEAIQLYSLE